MGVQNKLTQDVPQWYIDYFELKAILVSGSRKMSVPLINCLEFEWRALFIRVYQR